MKKWIFLSLFLNGTMLLGQKRLALIIGNANYESSVLRNPRHDAEDMAAAAKQCGFELVVPVVLDADKETMERALEQFQTAIQAAPDAIRLFYFSGHGVQVDGKNYLLSVKNKHLQDRPALKNRGGLLLDEVLERMHTDDGCNLVILDACRNNPLPKGVTKGGGRGLTTVETGSGTIVMYATAANTTAEDGSGRNGTFTEILKQNLVQQGWSLTKIFQETAQTVSSKTGKQQNPELSIKYYSDIILRPNPTTASTTESELPQSTALNYEALLENGFFYLSVEQYEIATQNFKQAQKIKPSKKEAAFGEKCVKAIQDYNEQMSPPSNAVQGKTYAKCHIPDTYKTVMVNGKSTKKIIRVGGWSEWREMYCTELFILKSDNGHYGGLSPAQITQLQTKLKEKGYYFGVVDGQMNKFVWAGLYIYMYDIDNRASCLGGPISDCLLYPTTIIKQRVADSLKLDFKYKEDLSPKLVKSDFTEVATGVSFKMKYLTSGYFQMGSNDLDAGENEKTVHNVRLNEFYIGEYEVTVGEYLKFCRATDRNWPEWLEKGNSYHIETGTDADKTYYSCKGYSSGYNETLPIAGVSWDDAVAYCKWLSRTTGKTYRLPTEAEWEYAAQSDAGSSNFNKMVWYSDNSDSKPHPVGQKQANGFGLYDMLGNVSEWCSDYYGKYSSGLQSNPTGPTSGSEHVYRGGNWSNAKEKCRISNRSNDAAAFRSRNLGFRIVCVSDIINPQPSKLSDNPPKSVKNDLTQVIMGTAFVMKYVASNSFQMGGDDMDANKDEKPIHNVQLSDFYMSKYEVTVGAYLKFCQATNSNWPNWLEEGNEFHIETGTNKYYYTMGYRHTGGENLPIVGVSWDNATAYCKWLSSTTGKTYRLPTEAEWEYSARGGESYPYAGSSNIQNTAWYSSNSDSKPHPVGQKQANGFGLYDMAGNVWEWCSDFYGNYNTSSQSNPVGAATGFYRVLRGGGWNGDARLCRVSLRDYYSPAYRNYGLGFRVVCLSQ